VENAELKEDLEKRQKELERRQREIAEQRWFGWGKSHLDIY
jgi:hypothetical protein